MASWLIQPRRQRLGVRWQRGKDNALASVKLLSRGESYFVAAAYGSACESGVAPRLAARSPRRFAIALALGVEGKPTNRTMLFLTVQSKPLHEAGSNSSAGECSR